MKAHHIVLVVAFGLFIGSFVTITVLNWVTNDHDIKVEVFKIFMTCGFIGTASLAVIFGTLIGMIKIKIHEEELKVER